MKLPELLAPAGNLTSAEAAFDHGADAIYIGIDQLNLRAHAPNFDPSDLPSLIDMAEKRGKRVYVALNIMPDNALLSKVEKTLTALSAYRFPHAFIVSDPGVISLCKEIAPSTELHLSTQTGTFNSRSINFWASQGISRFVAPRELTLGQIRELAKEKLEVEVFIHGAMCVSISGRCLLGAYVQERHPNFGDCPQPCRFTYKIAPINNDGQSGEWLTVEESENGVYLLNSKDLCTISILPDIINTGVASLKIEGRNKGPHYVAAVVKVYREALDLYANNPLEYSTDPNWEKQLDKVEHHKYTTGFYNKELIMQDVFTSKASQGYRVIGMVKGLFDEHKPVLDVKNTFSVGEELEVLPVQQKLNPYSVKVTHIEDLRGNTLLKALSNRLVVLSNELHLRTGDILRRKQ